MTRNETWKRNNRRKIHFLSATVEIVVPWYLDIMKVLDIPCQESNILTCGSTSDSLKILLKFLRTTCDNFPNYQKSSISKVFLGSEGYFQRFIFAFGDCFETSIQTGRESFRYCHRSFTDQMSVEDMVLNLEEVFQIREKTFIFWAGSHFLSDSPLCLQQWITKKTRTSPKYVSVVIRCSKQSPNGKIQHWKKMINDFWHLEMVLNHSKNLLTRTCTHKHISSEFFFFFFFFL